MFGQYILLLFLKLIFVSCAKKSSLTFVIDDTKSMGNEIDQVKVAASAIMDIVEYEKASEIEDIILVTFNDPAVNLLANTSNRMEFLRALRSVQVHNDINNECPEYSLSGIERALIESRPDSYLFVFTDASAKDHWKLANVKRLCQMKQSQIFFILTGHCHKSSEDRDFRVYHEIAMLSNGQVFRVGEDQVTDVIEVIKTTIQGQLQVVTSQVTPDAYFWRKIKFTVDDLSEYMIVSATGTEVAIIIKDSDSIMGKSIPLTKILWTKSGKVVKFTVPEPGDYYAWVKGRSDVFVVVYARTNFGFKHGFSTFVPNSLDDTSKQPILGERNYLSVLIDDSNGIVGIQYVDILKGTYDPSRIPLRKVNNNWYMSELFIAPSITFKIQLVGENVKTGNAIKRLTKSNIEPQDPPKPEYKVPEVIISEGVKYNVDFDGNVSLTCKVSAYPEPKIVWTNENNEVVGKDAYLVEAPYNYISYLNVPHVKKDTTYYCNASNYGGIVRSAMIQVISGSTFEPISIPNEVTTAKFGEEKRITCDVQSKHPLNVKWSLPLNPSEFSLSADNKVLTIKSVDMNAQGRYICKTSLVQDPNIFHTAVTTLQIIGLEAPSIVFEKPTEVAKESATVNLYCRITGGVPRPRIFWQKKIKNDVFIDVNQSGEMFRIEHASVEDSGIYRCIANNSISQVVKEIDLQITKAPKAKIIQGTLISVPYGSIQELKCMGTGNPIPTVVWTDSKGNKLISSEHKENYYSTNSSILVNNTYSETYTCNVLNMLGHSEASTNIDVMSPIIIESIPAKIEATYGNPTTILCKVTSNFPLRIRWFFDNGSTTGKQLIRKSYKYKISHDRKELQILSTDIESTGTYICEATLISDSKQTVIYTSTVNINNKSPPNIQDADSVIVVNYGGKAIIPCKIIGGVPPPQVSWQMMANGDNEYKDLPISGEELTIDTATFEYSGSYRCIASNTIGDKVKTVDLIISKAPEVHIQNGRNKSYTYGKTEKITCIVSGNPTPKIKWTDKEGNILKSQEETYDYTTYSHITINNKGSNTYYCNAVNNVGSSENKINTIVKLPINVITKPPEYINSIYGKSTSLSCNFESNSRMSIKWFFDNGSKGGKRLISTSSKYKISSDKKSLEILSTDTETTGKYTCEATLLFDNTQKVSYTSTVKINDISPPELKVTAKAFVIRDTNNVTISCKIKSGTPLPTITWQVKPHGSTYFQDLPDKGEQITIINANVDDTGLYRCTAENNAGKKNKTIELVVQKSPVVTIDEGSKATVTYGSTNEYKCRVIGNPLPNVIWKNSTGNLLKSKIIVDKYETLSILTATITSTFDSYTCFANSDLGERSSTINVTVSSAIDFPDILPEQINVEFGNPVTINCNARAAYPTEIKWYFEKKGNSIQTEVKASEKYKITDKSTLVIVSADLDTIGKYTCEVNLVANRGQTKSHTTKLEINNLRAPKIFANAKVITMMKYESVNTSCKFIGIPKPIMTWEFKAKGSDKFIPIDTIGHTGYGAAGIYKCIATNALGSAHDTMEIIVQGEPEITNGLSEYVGVTGDSVLRVVCSVTGIPEPTIVWKLGDQLLHSDDTIIIEKNELFIKNPTVADNNGYTCEATNKFGNAKTTLFATISDILDVDPERIRYIYLNFGESKEITCDIPTPKPPLSVRWYVNGELTTANDYVFNIQNASSYHDGNYTCRVNTDHGSMSLNYIVDVGNAPTFIESPDPLVYWDGNINQLLDCNVYAKQQTVSWIYNGNEVQNKYTQLAIRGWGSYSCNVSNGHGSVQRSFKITSSGCLINRTLLSIGQNTPLLIDDKTGSWSQLLTNNEFYKLNTNETIRLLCATKNQQNNTFKILPAETSLTVMCDKEDKFIIGSKTYKFDELQCSDYVKPLFVATTKSCMINGSIIEVGFDLDSEFLSIYEVCYEEKNHRILNTKVNVSTMNFGNNVDPGFDVIGGNFKKCQFNKRRLVRPDEVAFGPPQNTILSDVYNSIPVFEPCQDSPRISWSDIEGAVHNVLDTGSFTLWTGASEYDDTGTPRYLWKVLLMDDSGMQTIVYVNAQNPTSEDIKCPVPGDLIVDLAYDLYAYPCSLEDFNLAFNVSVYDLFNSEGDWSDPDLTLNSRYY